MRVYDAAAGKTQVPLQSDHPLVLVLKECLGSGDKCDMAARAGAQEVAVALLEEALRTQVLPTWAHVITVTNACMA